MVKELTTELGVVRRERDMLRRELPELKEDQAGPFTTIAPFTSIGTAAENIIKGLVVHGFENDEGASRIINGFRPAIETAIDRAVSKAMEYERERVKREIEGMFK